MKKNSNFYTNVAQYKGKILVRGYFNGKRYSEKVKYKPYLFVKSDNKNSIYTDHKRREKISKIDFSSISDAKNFIEQYKDVDNFKLYGMDNFIYPYINDEYPEIEYNADTLSIVTLDIEVASDEGMPSVDRADKEVTAITIEKKDVYYTFGCKDFEPEEANHKYLKCKDENDLLHKFLDFWKFLDPDIVTGWYSDLFDIPYLHNRLTKLFGKQIADSLSPWGIVYDREINQKYGIGKVKVLVGIAQLDYMILYKKFSYTPQENYRLNTVASHELGLGKIEFSGSLTDLYKTDYKKFILYNKRDVSLVKGIDKKRKFIDIVLAIAYDAKVNFIDAIGTVLLWDVIIHNYLMKKNIVVPFKQENEETENSYPQGGHVKDPLIGYHENVGSWDFDSLYPHLIMMLNISSDTFVSMADFNINPDLLLEEKIKIPKDEFSYAVNGAIFKTEFQGFMAVLMENMYQDRLKYKKQMIEAKKENIKKPSKELENKIAALDSMQQAKKIELNSMYGALANAFFRWYDIRLAEAITITGQYCIRYIEKKVNEYLSNLYDKEDDYVIASDTDSVYIKFNDLKFDEKRMSEKIAEWTTEIYTKLNAYKDVLKMKRESIAINGIWTGKKHYVLNVIDSEGVVYDKPKLKITGLEVVKSSTPSACKEGMRKALEIILNGNEKELIELVKKTKKEFMKKPYEDISFPKSVNDLKKYSDKITLWSKGAPIQVKGSLVYNDFISRKKLNLPKINDADKIKFCYLKTPNPVKSEVISTLNEMPKEFGLDAYIDYETQFNKAFVKPIEEVAKHRNWSLVERNTLF